MHKYPVSSVAPYFHPLRSAVINPPLRDDSLLAAGRVFPPLHPSSPCFVSARGRLGLDGERGLEVCSEGLAQGVVGLEGARLDERHVGLLVARVDLLERRLARGDLHKPQPKGW